MGILKQEYWRELPCPPRGDLPDPGIDPMSLMSPALADRFFTTNATYRPWDHKESDTTEQLITGTRVSVMSALEKASQISVYISI